MSDNETTLPYVFIIESLDFRDEDDGDYDEVIHACKALLLLSLSRVKDFLFCLSLSLLLLNTTSVSK